MKDWRTERYHAPSDDANQPVNLAAAAGYEEVIRALTVAVASDPRRPAWKQDSFFRRYAASAGNRRSNQGLGFGFPGSQDALELAVAAGELIPCPWSACFKPAFNPATCACNDCQAAEVALKSLHRSE